MRFVQMVLCPEMDHRIALAARRIPVTLDELDGERAQVYVEPNERRFSPERF